MDLEKAMLDPGSVFATPREVLLCEPLTRRQKIDILQRWEYDAAEGAVALEEGMPGPESDLQRQILLALGQLSEGNDVEQVGPTKHHGLPTGS